MKLKTEYRTQEAVNAQSHTNNATQGIATKVQSVGASALVLQALRLSWATRALHQIL